VTLCYTSAVYVVIVCPSVCPSQTSTVPKRLKVASRKQRHTSPGTLVF